MDRTKIALLIIVIVCIVLVFFWFSQPPAEGEPKFEIVDFIMQETGPRHHRTYQSSFKIKNVGTGDATDLNGTIKWGNWERTWIFKDDYFNPRDPVLKPGGTTPRDVIVGFDKSPTNQTQTIIIVVQCSEGVTQEFTQSLPPTL